MAKLKTPSRSIALAIVSTLLSLAAVIVVVIVFVAGVKPGVLDDLALFKVCTRSNGNEAGDTG